jgi:hypothetical protein
LDIGKKGWNDRDMGKLHYDGQQWIGNSDDAGGLLCVSMSDATFQRRLSAYLQSIGVPTQTYLELMRYTEWVCEQRRQAIQQLSNLEYWRNCNDPDVRIFQSRPSNQHRPGMG